jgi:nucleoside-diphosphate-sugar epimerase
MQSILVTGGTGFIGSHLLPKLHKRNLQIVLAVRNHLSNEFNLPYKIVKVNEIDESTDWTEALKEIDTVIHLAARAHQLNDQALDPEAEFLQINCEGTKTLVKQAIAAGVKHFIFISSIGAMATLSDTIISEESPCQPDTPYGRSKLNAETALVELCRKTQMNWTILRPTLVYGPNNPGNMERLFALVTKKLPLPLGSIVNSRSLLYVGNLVDVIIKCIEDDRAKNQTFIVSDGVDLSTSELIFRMGNAMGEKILLLSFPPSLLRLAAKMIKKEEVADRLLGSLQVDSSKIRQMLDWKPPYTVDQGLQATADCFKQR